MDIVHSTHLGHSFWIDGCEKVLCNHSGCSFVLIILKRFIQCVAVSFTYAEKRLTLIHILIHPCTDFLLATMVKVRRMNLNDLPRVIKCTELALRESLSWIMNRRENLAGKWKEQVHKVEEDKKNRAIRNIKWKAKAYSKTALRRSFRAAKWKRIGIRWKNISRKN